VLGELERIFDYLLIYLKGIFGLFSERNETCHEFKENCSKRPQISWKGVAFTRQCLRGHIAGRANHGKSLLNSIQLLASTKIDELQVPVEAYHHIFRF
jgi:hypothetical protein